MAQTPTWWQPGVRVNGRVEPSVEGHAARAILAEGVDVIMMGSRGLSDLAGLHGSVNHNVIQLSHCTSSSPADRARCGLVDEEALRD